MATETQPSKAVLILTGAWHTPEHYVKLINDLTEKGIRVLCPHLPSNNNAYPPNKYLADDVACIRDIVTAEAAAGTHLTVLAHSWGGIVSSATLTEFALPPSAPSAGHGKSATQGGVAQLIFMAAFLPFEHESLAGIFGGTLPPWLSTHDDDTLRWTDPIGHLYSDLPKEEAQALEDKRVWHSSRAQFTDINVAKTAWRVIPVNYILCEGDQALPLPVQEMMVGRVREAGVAVREFRVPGGHFACVSMPERIVEVVVEVMKSSG